MATWKMVVEVGTSLPEVEVGLWFKKPALVVAGKGLIHLGDGSTPMSFPTPEKDDLLAARPDAYFEDGHLAGTPWVRVHLAKITKAELREHLRDAWRLKAPKALRTAHPEV